MFQNDFFGRAEIGTTGSDALEIKVSADGNGWTSALNVDPHTGSVDFPVGASRDGNAILDTAHTPDVLSYQGGIGNAVDFNNMRETGLFLQYSTVFAANGVNYPIEDAGLLTVVEARHMTFQTYQVFSASVSYANQLFVGGRHNSGWSDCRAY